MPRSIKELTGVDEDLKPARSMRVRQQTIEYLRHLGCVFTNGRRICVIDPFLDPASQSYKEIPQLLLAARNRNPQPCLEIHRKCNYKPQGERERPITLENEWRAIFRLWNEQFDRAGLRVEIRIWDEFHNRYFLSEILGLHVGKGFIASRNPRAIDAWSRLSRDDRVKVDREFDENNSPDHQLWCRFSIGAV